MEIIVNNPYRIAGVLSNVSAKELEMQKAKTNAYSRVGKEITSKYDFDFIKEITRTPGSINQAFAAIQQNPDKVHNSLFWFIEDLGLNHLVAGNEKKAVEIWEKVTQNKDVNSKNFSAFNNLGTYKFLSKNKDEIKQGIEVKIKLIESDYFKNFVLAVADETHTIDNKNQIKILIYELLSQFKNKYSSSQTIALFSNCNGSVQKYLSEKITEEPIYKIENQIEITKGKRKTNPSKADEFGLNLYNNCKNDLSFLKSLFGTNDLRYIKNADNLAKEIMQCGIDYFKEWQNTKGPGIKGLKLLKYAESIAINSQTRDRVKDNIEGIEEWIDNFDERELNKKIEKEVEFIVKKLNFTVKTLDNKGKYPKGYDDPYSKLPLAEQPHNKPIKKTEFNFFNQPISQNNLFDPSVSSEKNDFNINLFLLARDLVKDCKPKLDHIENIVNSENELFKKLSNNVANISLACMIVYINNEGDSRPGIPTHIDKHDINVIISIGGLYMNPETLTRYKTNKSTLFEMFKSTAPKSEQKEIAEIKKEIDDERKYRIKAIIIISAIIIIVSFAIWFYWGLDALESIGGIIGFIIILGILGEANGRRRY